MNENKTFHLKPNATEIDHPNAVLRAARYANMRRHLDIGSRVLAALPI